MSSLKEMVKLVQPYADRIAALKAENIALEAELEAMKGMGLASAAELAGLLYRNIKSDENDGVGHLALRFTEKDGRMGAVVVLAPDDGNIEILDAIDAIYNRQDQTALVTQQEQEDE